MTGLSAGYAIGIVGDAGVRAYVHESKIFVTMVLVLIFAYVPPLSMFIKLTPPHSEVIVRPATH